MRRMLSISVALVAVTALSGAALACDFHTKTVKADTLITADVTTPSGPQTPVPPKTEPEG